jgi:hypothetical protein
MRYICCVTVQDLRAINSMVHLRANNGITNSGNYKRPLPANEDSAYKRPMAGISRRLSTVLDDRQRSSDSGLTESTSLPGSLSLSNGESDWAVTVSSGVTGSADQDENAPLP